VHIIADDLTGAADTSVAFSGAASRRLVLELPQGGPDAAHRGETSRSTSIAATARPSGAHRYSPALTAERDGRLREG
jgi:uncharacterized protein YgbK (DUF1537 family)